MERIGLAVPRRVLRDPPQRVEPADAYVQFVAAELVDSPAEAVGDVPLLRRAQTVLADPELAPGGIRAEENGQAADGLQQRRTDIAHGLESVPRVHARPGEIVIDHRARQEDEYRADRDEAHRPEDGDDQRPSPPGQSVPPRTTTGPRDLHGHGSLGGAGKSIKAGDCGAVRRRGRALLYNRPVIYHVVSLAAWNARPDRPYAPASLPEDGFVHCSPDEATTLAVVNAFYRDAPKPLHVLVLDEERLDARVEFEAAAPAPPPGVGADVLFPTYSAPSTVTPSCGSWRSGGTRRVARRGSGRTDASLDQPVHTAGDVRQHARGRSRARARSRSRARGLSGGDVPPPRARTGTRTSSSARLRSRRRRPRRAHRPPAARGRQHDPQRRRARVTCHASRARVPPPVLPRVPACRRRTHPTTDSDREVTG